MNFIKFAENYPLRQESDVQRMQVYTSGFSNSEVRETLLQRSLVTPKIQRVTFSRLYSQQQRKQQDQGQKEDQLQIDDLLISKQVQFRPKSSGKSSLKIQNIIQSQKIYNSPDKSMNKMTKNITLDTEVVQHTIKRSRVLDQQYLEKIRPFDLIREKPQNKQPKRVPIQSLKLYQDKIKNDHKIFSTKSLISSQASIRPVQQSQQPRKTLCNSVDFLFQDVIKQKNEILQRFTPVINANQNYNTILQHWNFINGKLPEKIEFAQLVKVTLD
ncbi:hypothetical protein SS50377_25414 [Spironucleus salmonicida]|uniref:Uncharacterized protein n=1 Tax=Spironucleus salmonicida TaxID=348837 RepID=V6LVW1_9EUKA|nr:hypothetical protein SS50377_25414 [Spironucleus salmonicida]|eukprot:EST44959.1 Hypothetical protein SS50377_14977 [Spironucleus salmonicida]